MSVSKQVAAELRDRCENEILLLIENEKPNSVKPSTTLSFNFVSGACVYIHVDGSRFKICSYGTKQ